jgi:hypothetical protein
MTRWAKRLVFVNLVLSLVLATWALGVFSQRIDWGKKAASVDRPAGELAKRLEEIDRLGGGSKEGARQRAETRWAQARKDLLGKEEDRKQKQGWYAQQLEVLEKGMIGGKAMVPPVMALVYDQGGIVLDATGRPQLRPVPDRTGKPVGALQALDQEYLALHKDIKKTMQEIAGLIQEEQKLTLNLNGDGPRKGLRRQLADEQAETDKCLSEQDYLKPLFYNRQAEAQLLQERQKALQDRLRELQSAASLSRAP